MQERCRVLQRNGLVLAEILSVALFVGLAIWRITWWNLGPARSVSGPACPCASR
jgi:hypothetical protein